MQCRSPLECFPRAIAAVLALCAVALAPLAWAGAQVEEQLSASVQASLQAAISDRAAACASCPKPASWM